MRPFAISVVGRDRPGIVAALTGALLAHRANIEDSRMTILRGHLAMTLVVALPEEADPGALGVDLEEIRAALELESLTLAPVAEVERGPGSTPSHVVSVYGADHPGIVHAVSAALAERGWNITDLATRLVGEDGPDPLYTMILEVAVPGDAPAEEVDRALAPVGRAEGVEITSRPLERDAL